MSALYLSIDIQNVYKEQSFHSRPWTQLIRNNAYAIRRFRAENVPVLHVIHCKYKLPEINKLKNLSVVRITNGHINFPDPNIVPSLVMDEYALVASKNTISAKAANVISDYVERIGPDVVILGGLFEGRGDIHCVTQTAKDFSRDGYRTIIAAETTNVHVEGEETLEERRAYHNQFGVAVEPIETIAMQLRAARRLMTGWQPGPSSPVLRSNLNAGLLAAAA
jgi:nicotinamidase-related amidase